MTEELTALELGRLVGEPVERVEEWRALGLLGREDTEAYKPEDVQRARLVQLLLRRGIDLPAIVRAEREEGLLARHVPPSPGGAGPAHSPDETAEQLGLELETLRRLRRASGISDQSDLLYESDFQALRAFKLALDAGIPEDALLQLARVYADALGRVAEAETHLFHFYVHERLKTQGHSGRELAETVHASRERVAPLSEPLVLYFHRKGWENALREDAVFHAREHAGLSEKAEVPGQLRVAIVFVDLAGFTSLAEAMGDEMATQVLGRFSDLVRAAVIRSDGRVVKQIGDAFMLVFGEPRSAVACAIEIERRSAEEPQFPAVRTGIQCGPVLYREGDYVGTSVNVAARLAGEAERHQILLTAGVRTEAASLPDVEFVPMGKRRLRGLAEELELFAAVQRSTGERSRRLLDPVCGMELDPGEVAARLSFGGRERMFCSQECLQRFVTSPERYG